MRTVKLVMVVLLAMAWLVLPIAQILNPAAIWILAAISAGFSVACLLSYVTYFHDAAGRRRALGPGFNARMIILLLGALYVFVFAPIIANPPRGFNFFVFAAFAIPLVVISWPRDTAQPVVVRPPSDRDDSADTGY